MTIKPESVMFARPPVWSFSPTVEHFRYVLGEGFVWNLVRSLVVAGLSTALIVVIGTPAAYAFARFPFGAGTISCSSCSPRGWHRRSPS